MMLQTICCDRCSQTATAPDRDQWARVYAASLSGTDLVGSSITPADLCGPCAAELRSWFLVPREDTSPRTTHQSAQKPKRNAPRLAPAEAACGSLLSPAENSCHPADPDGDPEWLTMPPEKEPA